MNTIIGSNPANRLVEVLAGSTALWSNPAGATSSLPLSLSSLDSVNLNDTAAGSPNSDSLVALLGSTPLGGVLGAGQTSPGIDGILGGGMTGAGASALDLTGQGTLLQPVFDDVNYSVKEVNSELQLLGNEIGLHDAVANVTNLDVQAGLTSIGAPLDPMASEGLVGDVLNAPSEILSGNLSGSVSDLAADVMCIVDAVADLKDTVLFNPADPTNPIPELISSIGGDLQNLPLISINGGNNAGDGGLLGGIVGQLSGSSSGHLIDLDIGPAQSSGGLVANILSAPEGGPHHTAEVNAVDVGPNGPHLLDLGVLTGDSGSGGVNIPLLSGGGADSLVGNVLGGDLLGGTSPLGGDAAGSGHSLTSAAPIDLAPVSDLLAATAGTDHDALNLHGIHII